MQQYYLTNCSVKRKEEQIKNYVCITVTCPFKHNQDENVYYYFGPYNLIFNGCENSCGSVICQKCGENNYDRALQAFEYLCGLYTGDINYTA